MNGSVADRRPGGPMPVDYPEPALFVAGEWRRRPAWCDVRNPATGAVVGATPGATDDDLADALRSADAAFAGWRATPAAARARILTDAAALLRDRADLFGRRLTLEQGKPVAEARLEFMLSAEAFEWYAAECLRAYGRVLPGRVPGARQLVLPEPVGPVLALTPWNFPALLSARKIAPALAAGCTCILKPPEETPSAGLALAEVLSEAGLPAGVLNVVLGDPARISSTLIASPVIRKVSFTGSVAVGRSLAVLAAQGLKPCTLELGGHAPVIVFDDADVAFAATSAAMGKTRNAGQVCTSPTRFIVQDKVYDRFLAAFAQELEAIKVGDGMAADTMMGPLATSRRRQAVAQLMDDAIDRGATVVTGGPHAAAAGWFWSPTILTDVPATAAIRSTEPFGPIATVQRFTEPGDAVRLANALPYGLAGYAFTRSAERAAFVGDALRVGVVGINSFAVSHIEAPFSGVNDSGYGYEGGQEGLEAYLHRKYVNHL